MNALPWLAMAVLLMWSAWRFVCDNWQNYALDVGVSPYDGPATDELMRTMFGAYIESVA